MDMTVMDLPMAANHMGIVTLPHITPLHMDRHIMVIHITHTATPGKGIRSLVKLVKEVPTKLGQAQLRVPHNPG
jgi:hypothetical protein